MPDDQISAFENLDESDESEEFYDAEDNNARQESEDEVISNIIH